MAKESQMPVGFAHLHNPLFFAGRNWGEKLDVRNTTKGKLAMVYDRLEKELIVECEGLKTFIPSSNIVSYSPPTEKPLPKTTSGASANTKIQAQASGPHDHVFAGLGAGQTGVGAKVK